jgi:hypothetical protein
MERLLKPSRQPGRSVVSVANLLGKKAGDNSHLWYAPDAAPAVATAISEALSPADPSHSADCLAATLALTYVWLGLTVAFYTDWPVSFCIALLSGCSYLLSPAAPRQHLQAEGTMQEAYYEL